MRLAILLITIPSLVTAQTSWKDYIPSTSLMFLAGAADGTVEALQYRYYRFEQIFPTANDQFWNPQLSWRNKYKNGDPALGPKHVGSTTWLVWTTDGYHMIRHAKFTFITGALIFKFGEKKKRWYKYLIDAGIYSLAYSAGIGLTYEWMFRKCGC